MVPARQDVNTRREQFLRSPGGQALPTRGVFPICNDEINAPVIPEAGEPTPNSLPAGTTKNVTDKENPHHFMITREPCDLHVEKTSMSA